MGTQKDNRAKVAIIMAPDDKGLQKVFGIPAVRRLILLIQKLDLNEIHIIGQTKPLQPILSDLIPPERFHPVETPGALEEVIQEIALDPSRRVLVLKASQVIDRPSLARLLDAAESLRPQAYMLARGEINGERIYSIMPSELVPILRNLESHSPNPSPPGKFELMQGADGLPDSLDGRKERVRIVEEKLMKTLAAQTAADDGFLARHVSRHVSRFMSWRIVRTSVTPNQITLGGAGIGMIGALLLAWGSYWPQLFGSLLFLLCIIVDGVDGEIARLKMQESPGGHRLDIIADNVVHIAIFTGLALGLYRGSGDPVYLQLLGVLLGGFALCGIAVYQCILKRSPEELERSGLTLKIMVLMSNRDFAYILVILALLGLLHWFLIGAAGGTYLFAATLWMITFYEKRAIAG